ncbi:MAG: hypothetical protein HUJ69_05600 [Lachnospiraceae bacterium]|nr:hypothetical protein [Lachnospiraceae bacterium]
MSMLRWGGYDGAERICLLFYPDYLSSSLEDEKQQALCLLHIKLADKRFLKRIPEHRDYLGAILGTGIKREKVGDIGISEDGAYVFVLREIAGYLVQELTSVGPAVVTVEEAPHTDMPTREKGKEMLISLASLRMDSVVAHGFHLGRGDAAKAIRAGIVLCNGAPVTDPDKLAHIGDKITLRGKGRVILREDRGPSRSGRIQVLVEYFGK